MSFEGDTDSSVSATRSYGQNNPEAIASGNIAYAGSRVVFTAAPEQGKVVRGWTVNGSAIPGSAEQTTYEITAIVKRLDVKVSFGNPLFLITFNANSGSVTPASDTTGEDGKLSSLPTPTREHYGFAGWFTAASGGEPVTTDTIFDADTTIHAQWTVSAP